jgi:uncharacterized hydrophobic protein (TIGR00271 family)
MIIKMKFLIIACIMAAIGLDINSSTMVIASMIISPLSAPILTFIKNIFNKKYNNLNLLYELLIFIFISILLGFIYGKFNVYNVPIEKTINNNNEEIESRSNGKYYLQAFLFAVISGLAIYLSFNKIKKSYNLLNLIGVGIGASLLPPLVNSGILLSRHTEIDNIKAFYSFKLSIINIIGLITGIIFSYLLNI